MSLASGVLPYSQRPEWRDITPIPQHESLSPLAPIFYTDEYRDCTDYFRGIVKTGETSNRVLELTEDIIRLNPAHYSAWQYRYKTLISINSPLDLELLLMDEIATTFLKNYQVWHHRRLLLTHIYSKDPETKSPDLLLKELKFIGEVFEEDSKNYHTWSYRQWILSHFNRNELWAVEIPFIERMINEDVRNNSAWHHRFFVVFDSGVRQGDEDREDILRREVLYTKGKISLAPNNLSPWNYLRGILDRTKTPSESIEEFVFPYTKSEESLEPVVDLDNPPPSEGAKLPAVPAVEFLADIRESQGRISEATELFRLLGDKLDTIRKRYWDYRIKENQQKS